MKIDIIKTLVKSCEENDGWGLCLALRNRKFGTFEKAGIAEIWFPSIEISEKSIRNIKVIYHSPNWATFELIGNIIDSENYIKICVNRKLIFKAKLNEFIDDHYRFSFLRFGN